MRPPAAALLGALLAALAPAVFAQAPRRSQDQEASDAISRSIELSGAFDRDFARGQEVLQRMRRLREELPRARDLQASVREFDRLSADAERLGRGMRALVNEYSGLQKKTWETSVAKDAYAAYDRMRREGKGDQVPDLARRVSGFNVEAVKFLNRRSSGFLDDTIAEKKAFYEARAALLVERAEDKFMREVAYWTLAVVLVGLCAWGLVVLRRPAAAGHSAAPEPPSWDMPPVVGGHFKVLELIGQGALGEVYEAEDTELRRKVAVQSLRRELSSDERELARFLSEARLAAALKHPNLARVYSVVNEPPRLYLVLERVPGRTLRDVLRAEGRLAPARAARVLDRAAAALDYAHSMKAVHRGLSPESVVLAQDDQVKVTHFGEAGGGPCYAAPEQEPGRASKSADLYALAACFYEALTGAPPFPGPDFPAQKRAGAFLPPTKAVPGLPPAIDEVLRRALAAEPGRRYGSGAELSEAVRAAGIVTGPHEGLRAG